MRIAVSGAHATGKTTLISDFLDANPEYTHEPEPYESMDEMDAEPDGESYFRQLRISASRLGRHRADARVIAERAPLDFVAYLLALEDLGRGGRSSELTHRASELAASAMAHIDLLVVLPVSRVDDIEPDTDEDHDLRDAMNDALLDLAADDDMVPTGCTVVELSGSREARLAALRAAVTASESSGP